MSADDLCDVSELIDVALDRLLQIGPHFQTGYPELDHKLRKLKAHLLAVSNRARLLENEVRDRELADEGFVF